ncbi:MAG: sulfatase-like hydrolase/transferase [Planctomycetes bacterium]|nr:sulfatase-like hydrolase/transferase [Planctomycetota bacterium]
MNLLVVAVDRLHAGYLGCFGNTWIETPAFDRLAAESFALDQVIVHSTDLAELYRGWWQLRATKDAPTGGHLLSALAAAGHRTAMLSDDQQVAKLLAGDAVESIELPVVPATERAEDVEQTHLSGVTAAALDWLAEAREQPFALWLHTGALGAVWDAPDALCDRYSDEEDAPTPRLLAPPHEALAPGEDEERLWNVVRAYAAQVLTLDACLDNLRDGLAALGLAENTLLAVVGVRGLALGEHHRFGCWDEAVCGETVHVPWLIHWPDGLARGERSQALVQPADLPTALLASLTQNTEGANDVLALARGSAASLRDRAVVASPTGEWGIRTAAWYLRHRGSRVVPGDMADSGEALLYAKPDDFWEQTDVAVRLPQVVEELEQAYRDARSHAASSEPLASLSPLLTSLWR